MGLAGRSVDRIMPPPPPPSHIISSPLPKTRLKKQNQVRLRLRRNPHPRWRQQQCRRQCQCHQQHQRRRRCGGGHRGGRRGRGRADELLRADPPRDAPGGGAVSCELGVLCFGGVWGVPAVGALAWGGGCWRVCFEYGKRLVSRNETQPSNAHNQTQIQQRPPRRIHGPTHDGPTAAAAAAAEPGGGDSVDGLLLLRVQLLRLWHAAGVIGWRWRRWRGQQVGLWVYYAVVCGCVAAAAVPWCFLCRLTHTPKYK